MTIKPPTLSPREVRAEPLRSARRAGGRIGALAVAMALTLAAPWVIAASAAQPAPAAQPASAAPPAPADRWDGDGGRAGPPVHVLEAGRFTVRANAVPTGLLSAPTAERNNIQQAPDRAVLNIVILERQSDGNKVTVPAQVRVTKENLLGQSETVSMRAMKKNDRISYLGEFSFKPLQNFRFVLQVRPAGSDQVLETAFEDRFVARTRR